MVGPPEPGSVMEALCLMVQIRREMKELYATHAVVQTVWASRHPDNDSTGEEVRSSFESYKNSLMPFLKNEIKREHDRIVEAMNEEARRGPMVVTAIAPMKVSSRLRQRVLKEVNQPPMRRQKW